MASIAWFYRSASVWGGMTPQRRSPKLVLRRKAAANLASAARAFRLCSGLTDQFPHQEKEFPETCPYQVAAV